MQVTAIGLDLAKNVFKVHGMTKNDEVVFNRPLRRTQLVQRRDAFSKNSNLWSCCTNFN